MPRKNLPADWTYVPRPPEPEPEVVREPERDENEVKFACELVLIFALMHMPRKVTGPDYGWITWCQKLAFSRPGGSYSHVFFWSMRILGDPGETLETFRKYLAWKWEEYESGRLRREGPRWA